MVELWIEFGVGKHYRFIPVNLIATSLGHEKVKALPFSMSSQDVLQLLRLLALAREQFGMFGLLFLK